MSASVKAQLKRSLVLPCALAVPADPSASADAPASNERRLIWIAMRNLSLGLIALSFPRCFRTPSITLGKTQGNRQVGFHMRFSISYDRREGARRAQRSMGARQKLRLINADESFRI